MALKLYFDASAIVPLIIDDALRTRSVNLLRTWPSTPVASDFGLAEVATAVARRVRTGEVTRDEAMAAHAVLDRWAGQTTIVPLSSEDGAEAARLLRRLEPTLRTPDALHIAIVRRLGLVLATFDHGMAEAARKLGVEVAGA